MAVGNIGCQSRRLLFLALLLLCVSGTIGDTLAESRNASLGASRGSASELIRAGVQMEQDRRWLDAIEHYESALESHPEVESLQLGLRRSKIHFEIARRYTDGSFENQLLRLSQYEALRLFDEVLQRVRTDYVDRISSTSFVAHGTESLYLALANPAFVKANVPEASQDQLRRLRSVLREHYWNKRLANTYEAHQTVSQVCDLARRYTGVPGAAVVMEYIFGGCNALDDYSNFLSPDRLDDLYGNIEGEFVGLGIEMKAVDGKGMLLVNVLSDSPAEAGGLRAGEFIVGIDGRECRDMSTDEAAKLLRGPSGSRVTLRVHNPESGAERSGTFSRRAVHVKSVPIARMLDREFGIGYIQMTGFQKTTPDELRAALDDLRRQGLRALIWDLRGNPGGLLTAAVKVLDMFIDHGVLVSTEGRSNDQNYSYSATSFGTLSIPLVLLVDGDSASASEIVAGAVKDHRRGTIVGRQTYGKWSVQTILPVGPSTGLRLTTARFFSPNHHNLSKIGVAPDTNVPEPELHQTFYRGASNFDPQDDHDIQSALSILTRRMANR